jgi:hypothetical protein
MKKRDINGFADIGKAPGAREKNPAVLAAHQAKFHTTAPSI